MARLRYTPAALEMMGAIHRYIAGTLQNPSGADNTVLFIRDQISLLKTSPLVGTPLSVRFDSLPERYMDARFLVCGNYIAIYRYAKGTVDILRIYHSAQDYIRHLV
ncbi:MAG: type II toxin-antitoxin system RelE/ParE family toxin [Clostridiales Family XIII bacterium]|jgi:plasmid stabilization system protein ParE|nr:type II toxin-antitoxin system RelE/ParE family toxin [Clostridiales Family XIII bacterium]